MKLGWMREHCNAVRRCLHLLLSFSQLVNETASSMTSLSRPPIKSLPTHIPSPTHGPPSPPTRHFLWSCANFDEHLLLPEEMQHELKENQGRFRIKNKSLSHTYALFNFRRQVYDCFERLPVFDNKYTAVCGGFQMLIF